ncbi:hypothetical protein TELCIR_02140 [Teladorsagia circumcincta]|uniref:Uncharacterized protein n=1 Tax=Teladorsagia circumcincta TaxID=45464 RepID=A0A2G9V014_TELCI|nr:hypothetical protein TELCIR_02140 [Teladorsagia circumcincta]
MSLRPRVVPSRDHPYERTADTTGPASPTTSTLVVESMAKRLEKAVAAERRSYSARAVPGSKEGTPTSDSNGSKPTYRLAAIPRTASHVHPFDAELMTEEKPVNLLKKAEDPPSESAPQAPVVTSTSVARRVYVVKAAVPQPAETPQKETDQ